MATLSHSQMETWQQCRRRWQLEKIERAPRAPAEALIVGDAFHAALEADGRAYLDGGRRYNLTQLLHTATTALSKRLKEDDPKELLGGEDFAFDMSLRLMAMLRAYVEHVQGAYRPVAVERELTAKLGGEDGWTFTGRLDAITEHGIVDFKTSGKPWAPGIEHTKPQASAYYWLCNEWQTYPPQQCAFIVFSTQRVETGYTATVERRVTTRTAEQVTTWAYTAVATAREMEEAARTGEYPASPSPLCGWCGVLGSCDVGQMWLWERGRTPAVPLVVAPKPRAVR